MSVPQWGEKRVYVDQTGDGFRSIGGYSRDELSETEKFVFDALDDALVTRITVEYKNGLRREIGRA